MKKNRAVIKKIFKISKLVLSITDEEFEELETMAQEQCDYFNPLKCATTALQHALGAHNKRMIKCLRELTAELLFADKELQNG